ncbi:MAG: endonuclease/exonuclease/phosphatase family protein [Planctomycetes bacterium]|nr:endonuclease/exonuclease/phosphatase family protein [Planctomycetota bacterium]
MSHLVGGPAALGTDAGSSLANGSKLMLRLAGADDTTETVESVKKNRRPFLRYAWLALQVFVGLAVLATLCGFFARLWWPLELICHFRVQYFLILTVCAGLLLLGRRHRQAAIAGVFSLVNLAGIVPLYFGGPTIEDDKPSLRILSLNVLTKNKECDQVLELVGREMPDLIVLSEVNDRWITALNGLVGQYPYQRIVSRNDHFGIAVYSRIPLEKANVELLTDGNSVIAVHLRVNGQPLRILGAHVMSPVGRLRADLRNQQLAQLARIAAASNEPTILIGDLNITSWSPYFSDLVRDSGLNDSCRGFGLQSSWASPLLPFIRLPIDHCLVSPDVLIHDRRVELATGSDHDALIVDISLRR